MFRGKLGRLARGSPLGDERTPSFPLLRQPLGDNLLVGSSLFFIAENTVELFCLASTLALKCERSHQTLNLGRLAHGLALLVGEGAGDDILAHVVFLGEVEKLANVVGALGSKTTGDSLVGESWNRLVGHLRDNQVENGNVVSHNAPTDRLALALSSTALSVGLGSLFTEKTDASVGQDTLAHGESLLVVSSGNAHDGAIKLFSEDGAIDFLGHAAFVEVLKALLVINFNDLLHASARTRNVDLCSVQ